MKHRIKVSIKQTKKMKEMHLASQRIDLMLEMAFNVDNTPKSADKAMGVMAKLLTERSSLLHEYLDADGIDITHIEIGGKLYRLDPSCLSCAHADLEKAKQGEVVCEFGNTCDFCSRHKGREKTNG